MKYGRNTAVCQGEDGQDLTRGTPWSIPGLASLRGPWHLDMQAWIKQDPRCLSADLSRSYMSITEDKCWIPTVL